MQYYLSFSLPSCFLFNCLSFGMCCHYFIHKQTCLLNLFQEKLLWGHSLYVHDFDDSWTPSSSWGVFGGWTKLSPSASSWKNELMFIFLFCPSFKCFFIHTSTLFSPDSFSSVSSEGGGTVWPARLIQSDQTPVLSAKLDKLKTSLHVLFLLVCS